MKYDALYIRNVENQIESTCRVDTVGKGKRSKGEDSALGKREGNVKRKSSALNLVLNVTFIHASFLMRSFFEFTLPHKIVYCKACTRPKNEIFFLIDSL